MPTNFNIADYTFRGLRDGGKPGLVGSPSLCYLVSLTDSASHTISETLPAKRVLDWLFEMEEQAVDAEGLRAHEKFFERYFVGGFYPQTPCMVVDRWSPISAMLERGMAPNVLNREAKLRAVATGIWAPRADLEATEIGAATTDEALFWAILAKVSRVALEQKAWISVIAEPGWYRPSAINSLLPWPPEEVAKAGRVLWKRTADG